MDLIDFIHHQVTIDVLTRHSTAAHRRVLDVANGANIDRRGHGSSPLFPLSLSLSPISFTLSSSLTHSHCSLFLSLSVYGFVSLSLILYLCLSLSGTQTLTVSHSLSVGRLSCLVFS